MDPRSLAWMQRADAHLATARRELTAEGLRHPAAVCLHAQLSALACLRARLSAADVAFPYTSHLVVLLELCLEDHPDWERFRDSLRTLTQRAAAIDDPEDGTTSEQAEAAFVHAEAIRQAVEESLGA